jgi:DNA-binding protein HU-beta
MRKMAVFQGKLRSQRPPESSKASCIPSFQAIVNDKERHMAKKAAAPATITLKHLAAAIAEEQELSKKQAETILTDVVTRITKHLKKGERIRIVGLGILQVRKRAARMGRNPATGEAIHIKASKKVAFRAAKELKEAI